MTSLTDEEIREVADEAGLSDSETRQAIGAPRWRGDGWGSLITQMGVLNRDRGAGVQHLGSRIIERHEIDRMYRGDPTARRGVDLIPQDATRAGFKIKIDDDREDLDDVERATMQALRDLGAVKKLRRAMSWARLYGGAIAVIGDGTEGDGMAGAALPRREGSPVLWIHVYHRYNLTPGDLDADPTSPNFGRPLWYNVEAAKGIPGFAVHHTRVLRFDGVELPPDIHEGSRETLDGWGDSVLQSAYEALRDFGAAYTGAATMVSDFSQAIWSITGLRSIVASNGEAEIMRRIQINEMARSMANATIIDKDVEEFTRTSHSVAGYPDLLDRFGNRVSAAFGMPLTKLLGVSPGGFGTGEHEGRTWDEQVSAYQSDHYTPALDDLIGALFAWDDGPTSGAVPESWRVEQLPLEEPSTEQKAGALKTVAEALSTLVGIGIITPEEAAESAFGGEGLGTEIQLDAEARAMLGEVERETPPAPIDPDPDEAPEDGQGEA